MYYLCAFGLGIGLGMLITETWRDVIAKKMERLLAPKAEMLLEISSMKISQREKELGRELKEFEKDIIYDECYKEV